MKPIHRIIALGVLGCAALTAGSSALAQDMDACRGGYSILLMTPAECKAYLDQLQEVRSRSDRMAELDLQEWHTALLIQRAEACPCRVGKPVVLLQRTAPSSKPKKA
jgi:hypothetical protein